MRARPRVARFGPCAVRVGCAPRVAAPLRRPPPRHPPMMPTRVVAPAVMVLSYGAVRRGRRSLAAVFRSTGRRSRPRSSSGLSVRRCRLPTRDRSASVDYAATLARIRLANGWAVAAQGAPVVTSHAQVEWLNNRNDPGSTSYSPLDQINRDNVGQVARGLALEIRQLRSDSRVLFSGHAGDGGRDSVYLGRAAAERGCDRCRDRRDLVDVSPR